MSQKYEKMSEFIQVRLTPSEKSRLRAKALTHSNGNMSKYIVRQALEAPVIWDKPTGRRTKAKRL